MVKKRKKKRKFEAQRINTNTVSYFDLHVFERKKPKIILHILSCKSVFPIIINILSSFHNFKEQVHMKRQ